MAGKDFGKHVLDLRVSKGFESQRSFAKALGVSNATVARIERGESEPSNETLEKMADVLKTGYIELTDVREKAFRNEPKSVYDKMRLLNQEQISIITNIVDQFLKTESK